MYRYCRSALHPRHSVNILLSVTNRTVVGNIWWLTSFHYLMFWRSIKTCRCPEHASIQTCIHPPLFRTWLKMHTKACSKILNTSEAIFICIVMALAWSDSHWIIHMKFVDWLKGVISLQHIATPFHPLLTELTSFLKWHPAIMFLGCLLGPSIKALWPEKTFILLISYKYS